MFVGVNFFGAAIIRGGRKCIYKRGCESGKKLGKENSVHEGDSEWAAWQHARSGVLSCEPFRSSRRLARHLRNATANRGFPDASSVPSNRPELRLWTLMARPSGSWKLHCTALRSKRCSPVRVIVPISVRILLRIIRRNAGTE